MLLRSDEPLLFQESPGHVFRFFAVDVNLSIEVGHRLVVEETRQRVQHVGDRRILAEIATGRPVRVPLVEGQSARGLRTAISRAATSRGLSVETLEGDGFVAARKADAAGPQRGKLAPSGGGQRRRGRPPKLQA